MLKCECDRPEVGDEITEAFDGFRTPHAARAVFEHGQWWVVCDCGAQWSVNDAEGPGSCCGFSFEQVSEGDEDYHHGEDDA